MLRVPMIFSVEAPYLGLRVWFVPRDCLCSFIYLFISLIHQQSYQTVAAKGIRHADGKVRPTGTYSFPDKLSLTRSSADADNALDANEAVPNK